MGRLRQLFRHWNRRAAGGHAAVEFALIAPVFFLILMGIVETGMVYFANSALEQGMETAARMIRTGQVSAANMSQAAFRQVVCDQVSALLSCDPAKLYIDVRAFTNFAGAKYPDAIDKKGVLNPNLNAYQTGTACQVVLARGFYDWTLFTPIFAQYFANLGTSDRLLSASIAFRNEPYGATPC